MLFSFFRQHCGQISEKRFWIGPDTQNLGVLMEQLFYELKYKYTGYMIQVEALLQQCLVKVVRNYEGNRFSKQHFAPSISLTVRP